MKKLKKFQSFLLAIVVFFSTIGTTVYAAENNSSYQENVFCVTKISPYFWKLLSITTLVDNTFLVYGTHTGSSRAYSGNYIRYTITVSDENGNPVDNILAVRLYDNFGTLVDEHQFLANNVTNVIQNISISSGVSYYFQYLNAYGIQRNLKVHIIIESYN